VKILRHKSCANIQMFVLESLKIYSTVCCCAQYTGFKFCTKANKRGKKIALLNFEEIDEVG
jgi:hypothetical protein